MIKKIYYYVKVCGGQKKTIITILLAPSERGLSIIKLQRKVFQPHDMALIHETTQMNFSTRGLLMHTFNESHYMNNGGKMAQWLKTLRLSAGRLSAQV